jgi:hypothetical protein
VNGRRGRERTAPPRLFGPNELELRPTGQARLRALARRPLRSATERERRRDEDDATMQLLREWGADLAQSFGLRWRSLQREREGVNGHYGICYEDGVIRIRLRHATTGKLLKQSSLVDTLCHELAHLRYMDHSIRFRRLYQRILDRARALGYYRPGPEADGRPRQGSLFDDAGCGTRAVRK